MLTDPLVDFLIRIKNGYMARKNEVIAPHSKIKEALGQLLSKEGYVGNIKIKKETEAKKTIIVELIYEKKRPKVNDITIISRQGKRVYAGKNEIRKVSGGIGIVIISTALGLMTDKQAREKGVGGEIICKIL
jgi:small subunit ribosomal protein S8